MYSLRVATLDLENLGGGDMPGLTSTCGRVLAEAASVCLHDCQHASPTRLTVDGDDAATLNLVWPPVNAQALRTHADEQSATEQGACGIAILVTRELRGLTVLQRSRKGTGFDYWMGPPGTSLFADMVRLEISGIRRGASSDVTARVRRKTRQMSVSAGLPGIIVVVEFGRPLARMVDR